MKMASVLRKTHLYAALFLTPWILMYGISGFLMNHREFVQHLHNGKMSEFATESRTMYNGVFPYDAGPRTKAEQILTDMDIDGSFNAGENAKTGILTINRLDPVTPRRLTYNPADNSLLIERETLHFPAFIQRLHLRRGYQHTFLADDAWAFIVDIVIASIFFWCISGVVMWKVIRNIRSTGIIFLLSGFGLFLFLVLSI